MPGKDNKDSCSMHRMFSWKKSRTLKGRCCLGKMTGSILCLAPWPPRPNLISGGLAAKNRRSTFGLGVHQRTMTAELILDCLPGLGRVKMANSLSPSFSARYFRCRQEGSLELTPPVVITEETLCKDRLCFVVFKYQRQIMKCLREVKDHPSLVFMLMNSCISKRDNLSYWVNMNKFQVRIPEKWRCQCSEQEEGERGRVEGGQRGWGKIKSEVKQNCFGAFYLSHTRTRERAEIAFQWKGNFIKWHGGTDLQLFTLGASKKEWMFANVTESA